MEKYLGNWEVSFSRRLRVGACAGGEKSRFFGSGAGFLFVQTRHAQSPKITAHSTQPEPSVFEDKGGGGVTPGACS